MKVAPRDFSLSACQDYVNIPHTMNALSSYFTPDDDSPMFQGGQKDPTTIAWSPTLPIELALGTASPTALQLEYGYTDAEWAALRKNRVFLQELSGACELVRQEGMSFKLKAKMIAEENLKQVWKMVHASHDTVPPAVKGKLIELTAQWAGFANKGGGEGGDGPANANTLNIQINLGDGY